MGCKEVIARDQGREAGGRYLFVVRMGVFRTGNHTSVGWAGAYLDVIVVYFFGD